MKRFLFILLLGLAPASAGAVPASPGLVGHGSDTRHAFSTNCANSASPTVYYISNLNASGSGSLAECVESSTENRICAFEVSGEIEVNGRITSGGDCLWIAGQTAPSPGIHLYDTTLVINDDDVLVQHIRIRRGDSVDNQDSLQVFGGNRVVIDHVTLAWGTDETVSVVGDSSDVTVTNTMVAEALDNGYGSKGCIVNSNDSETATDLTFYHNLFALNKTRNCKVRQRFQMEWIGNTWYGNGPSTTKGNLFDIQAASAGQSAAMRLDLMSNTIIQGPGSGSSAKVSDCNSSKCPPSGALIHTGTSSGTDTRNNLWGTVSDFDDLFDSSIPSGTYSSGTAVAASGITDETAAAAYAIVITDGDVGSRPLDAAAQDTAWIAHVAAQSADAGGTTYNMSSGCAPDCNIFGDGTASVYPDCVEAETCSDYAVSAKPTFANNLRTLTAARALASPWADDGNGFTNFEAEIHANYTDAVEDNSGDPYPGDGGDGGTPPSEPTAGGFPQLSEVQLSISTGNAASHSVVLPDPIAEDDVCIFQYILDGGGITASFGTSSGTWTELNYTNNEMGSYVLWQRMDGTEDGETVTVTPSSSQEFTAYVSCFSGVHTTTAPEISCASADTATPNPPSLNPSGWGTEKTTWLSLTGHDGGDLTISSHSSGFENTFYQDSGGAGGQGQAFSSIESEAASVDPGAVTFSGSDGTDACTLGLRPAPAPVPDLSAPGDVGKMNKRKLKLGVGIKPW